MGELLFGTETEYALSGTRGRKPIDLGALVHQMLQAASERLVHLPDCGSSGMFLANGARLYLDCGLHEEFATPEVSNPWDAVRYIEAGHRTMLALTQSIALAGQPETEIACYRTNVDYSGSGSTWGCHESHLHKSPPNDLPAQLIPHLITRIIYTGAGGFDPLSPALEFTLSPRVAHIRQVISRESTCDRGIFHTKNEPLSQGYNRVHILCGESLCSHLAMFLKMGATSLVVAMADAGLRPGDPVHLAAPLEALRTVAADVHCRQRLRLKGAGKGGKTAIEIQRHYLSMAEEHAGDSFMPSWAPVVCARWRRVLDLLERGPQAVDKMLDWGIKLSLYSDRATRHGLNWDLLPVWADVAKQTNAALRETEHRDQAVPVTQALGPESPIPAVAARLNALLRSKGSGAGALGRMLELRAEFCEIDTRFGQLGPRGIFNMLEEAGVLDHHVNGIDNGVDNIEHALANPPATARAKVRGDVIRRLAREPGDWRCDWNAIFSSDRTKTLDLSDPFASDERWHEIPSAASSPAASEDSRFHRLLAGLLERH